MREKRQRIKDSRKFEKFRLTPDSSLKQISYSPEMSPSKSDRRVSKFKEKSTGYVYIKNNKMKQSKSPVGSLKVIYAHHGRQKYSKSISHRSFDQPPKVPKIKFNIS